MRLNPTVSRIYIENCGESFDCATTQNVLRGMECLGRKGIPSAAAAAAAALQSARATRHYRTEKMSRACVSAEQQQQGYALACRLYADEGDLHLQVVGQMQRALQPSDAAGRTVGN